MTITITILEEYSEMHKVCQIGKGLAGTGWEGKMGFEGKWVAETGNG